MTITNYIPTSDNNLFQNYDNRYIIYFQYDDILYVLRSNNRLTNNNRNNTTNTTTTTTTTTTTRPENVRLVNIRLDSNSDRIINYYTNRNDTITNDYIRNY
jgi:hypothetical protein